MTANPSGLTDLKVVLWRLPADHIPTTGNIAALDVAWEQNPGMLQHLADGWIVQSHTITALPDSLLLSLVLARPIAVPDTPAGALTWTHPSGTPTHRIRIPSPAAALTPPPELLLWPDGQVTWDKPGYGPGAK